MKIGFVASKRVGKSVQRNRAKRVLKALFLQYFESLPTGCFVFVAKKPILEADYTKLQKNFFKTVKKI